MASVSEFFFGSPTKYKKLPTGTPQQSALNEQILAQAMGMLGQGGGYNQAQNYYNSLLQPGNEAFDKFSQPYLNQFNEQTLPQIAERFAGTGALSSSGFGQALGGAASGLQSQLAQLFAQLQNQAAGAQTGQFNQLSQTGLNYTPFDYRQQQGSSGVLGNLLGGLGSQLGSPLGYGLAGGIANLFKKPATGGAGMFGDGGIF